MQEIEILRYTFKIILFNLSPLQQWTQKPRPDWPVRDSGFMIDFNNANSNLNKINYLLLKETLENFKEDKQL